ncbi:Rim9p [Lachancea thermotolerans CBS 6340]|uniref:KLTH0B04642p n=1 Tax=Lachancea thermotolerans (strain ATCC 56472 / CBS 6340 / NRRL Y-8284) TaxID=559295 RepID=C5DCP0_LACTC|nr:KLTH0B04642p [Lachancea thermotolerans CBS 6340]CAR21551.1 KLTH0B04642p [Lachancea thermotolerans CBS 6340]
MPSKSRSVIFVLLTLALIFQIFPTISIPVVDRIYLSTYNGRKFGVFGWCTAKSSECTSPRIGYEILPLNGTTEVASLFLPSRAKRSISKLLIVHPISLFFTFVLWTLALALNMHNFGQSRKILAGAVLWSLLTVLLSLLSFLVDILLFVPYLAWPGWLVLVSTVFIAVASSMMCIIRRAVSLRKYEKLRNRDNVELVPLRFSNVNSNSSKPTASEGVSDTQESAAWQHVAPDQPELVHRAV